MTPAPRRSALVALALALSVLAAPAILHAHAAGEDYVVVSFGEESIDGHFEVHFEDLEEKLVLELEAAGDDPAAAVRAVAPRVEAYIRRHFSVGPATGEPWELEFTGQNTIELPQGRYAQYRFRVATGPLPERLRLRHEMFYEDDPLHRGLLLVEDNARTGESYGPEYTALVFSPGNGEQILDLSDMPGLISPRGMIRQGVLHIWIGIDHILFLVALILPTVLRFQGDGWEPVGSFRPAFWNLLKIVTVFTVAHSVTLLLAALGLLSVPSRLVESMIALSIVLVAANNITGKVREGSLWVILFLGLFHGLGFASVMGHLPFRMVDLLKSVVAFNIGVELGQIAIVVALFPLLFLLRRSQAYVPVVLKGASAGLGLVAGLWFVQRALGLG